MRSTRVILFTGIILTLHACSIESLKRTGYWMGQGIQAEQCQKDFVSECPQRESYEAYQTKIKDLEASE